MTHRPKPKRNVKCVFLEKCKKCRRSLFLSRAKATRPYEIVHSDKCGPMQVESKGGSRYMLTFTDDFSTAYFIKSKSEVLSKFMEYVNSVEKHTYWWSYYEIEHSDRGRC